MLSATSSTSAGRGSCVSRRCALTAWKSHAPCSAQGAARRRREAIAATHERDGPPRALAWAAEVGEALSTNPWSASNTHGAAHTHASHLAPLLHAWRSVSPDAALASASSSPLRELLTSSLGHSSVASLLRDAAALAGTVGLGEGGDRGDEQLEPSVTIEPQHVLAALLLSPEHCTAFHVALVEAGLPTGAAAAQLLGTAPPPQRTTPAAGRAPAREPQGGADDALQAASVGAWRSLDTALEGMDVREVDLRACGFAASGPCQLLLLQAYRWAMFTGAAAVHPAHVAHALLVECCFSRFRTGFATHPPLQPLLEQLALWPGLACHQALRAVQLEMQRLALAGECSGAQSSAVPAASVSPGVSADAAAAVGAAAPSAAAVASEAAAAAVASPPAGAAVRAAADLLDEYGAAGLLPSRAALDALAASLRGAPSDAAAAILPPAPSDGPPPAVRVLHACAALGFRLSVECLPSLVLHGAAGSDSSRASAQPAGRWLTPGALREWLQALSFHGMAPQPYSALGAAAVAPYSALGAAVPTSAADAPGRHRAVVQPCQPWIEQEVLVSLATATAWELPALAARLSALAGVEQSWVRCAARATELACRASLSITPLWNGNRIYQDLLHIGSALLAMHAAATSAIAAAAAATPEGGAGTGASVAAQAPWLAVWAAAELPPQADRWARKLAARMHKGAAAGLSGVLPREPEWPSFEQAAGLLHLAARLAAAPGLPTGEAHTGGVVQRNGAAGARRNTLLHVPLGLRINLLAVLQAQLRTCSAGLHELGVAAAAAGTCDGVGDGADAGRGARLGRHASWLPAAQAAYAQQAVAGAGPPGAAQRSGSSAGSLVPSLLSPLVVGQVYRPWVLDLSPHVAAAVHACVRRAAAADAVGSGPVRLDSAHRCLARLHYPLAAVSSGAGASNAGGVDGSAGSSAVAEGVQHVPFQGSGLRDAGAAPPNGSRSRTPAPSAPALLVAKPYPDMRNLPPLPPLCETLGHLRAGRALPLSGAPAGLLVGLLAAALSPASDSGDDAAAAAAAAEDSAAASARAPESGGVASPSVVRTGSDAVSALPPPPGAAPRVLLLPDVALAAIARELVRGTPPEALRPEELWLLHVADRDARLTDRLAEGLRSSARAPATTATATATHVGAATTTSSFDGGLATCWAAWLDAARDAQLACAPECTSPLGAAATAAASALPDGAALAARGPPVLVPANIPRTAAPPLLPPVCRLELLLRARRHAPVQALVALAWQGDWYKGDAATLARFNAQELLYMTCALVHLYELQEYGGTDLGWLTAEAAADRCLQLLATPGMPQLLRHPAVAWGVGATGPYSPRDLAQEKRTRSQKLLDAAVGVREAAERALAALQFVARAGQSGVLGGGRLDPYRPLPAQGDSLAAFDGHAWAAVTPSAGRCEHGATPRELVAGGKGGGTRQEPGVAAAADGGGGGAVGEAADGVSLRGLRARRPLGGPSAERAWVGLLGAGGLARLRWALGALGHGADAWLAAAAPRGA